jgi:hypothetical protein
MTEDNCPFVERSLIAEKIGDGSEPPPRYCLRKRNDQALLYVTASDNLN